MFEGTKINLLIADDHQLIRKTFVAALEDDPTIGEICQAENGLELYEKYFNLHPDIIITDIQMPFLSGFEAVYRIKQKDPDVKALFLTGFDSEEFIYLARQAGAKGFVSKNTDPCKIFSAIHTIYNGNTYFGDEWCDEKLNELIKKYENNHSPAYYKGAGLTEREGEVAKLIVTGKTSLQIAEELNVTKKTIDYRRSSIDKKTYSKSIQDLLKYLFISKMEWFKRKP